MSQELDSASPAKDGGKSRPVPVPPVLPVNGNGNGSSRAPSATRRVRARLARRITAQRAASVKQVLEPLAAVHREMHPSADLALLQRAYD
ncbi:hypothetical protein ACFP1K_41305, partial [Sphaerisporangium aureirubrum]